MKRTATKNKTRLLKKNLVSPPRKSWLKIYSHVAYVVSAFNLFLFPARANVEAAPLDSTARPAFVIVSQQMPHDDIHWHSPESLPGVSPVFAKAIHGGKAQHLSVPCARKQILIMIDATRASQQACFVGK